MTSPMISQTPTNVKLHKKSAILELVYSPSESYELSAEFLRVHSPSAEVKGHGPGDEVLQFGKQGVVILKLEATGSYAIKPSFDDGHDSGIYSWTYLYGLCRNHSALWDDYLDKLHNAGKLRRALPDQTEVITLKVLPKP
jgi:DUF971 family protein